MMHKPSAAAPVTPEPLFKMKLPLDAQAWHGYGAETLWVKGTKDGRLQVCNSPFFFKGLSCKDWVTGEISGGELIYKALAGRGGHSTFRLVLMDDFSDADFSAQWKFMQSLGCSHESLSALRMHAIDVPEAGLVAAARKWLNAGLEQGFWDYDEGFVFASQA